MSFSSSLYVGSVMHHRLRPHAHRLQYRVFWMLLDIDEIDAVAAKLRCFSRNRFNLVSFYDRDFGDITKATLRDQIRNMLRGSGCDGAVESIKLLCMPRIAGYAFNPLSVFFCYRSDGSLCATIYEVHNTFGERHSYIFPCPPEHDGPIEQSCAKDFYVSPFLDMDMRYAFRLHPPGERIKISIRGEDKDGPLITTALMGQRSDLSDRSLVRAVLQHPLLTLKVVAAIHWHALRMVLQGFRIYPRSPGKPYTITVLSKAE